MVIGDTVQYNWVLYDSRWTTDWFEINEPKVASD
jgi:hypothetical protein